jgi:hypothetical protein
MTASAFADVDEFGAGLYIAQDAGPYQPVVHHDVGFLQNAPSLERQQLGVARP